jgi:hypothetical protein
MIVIIGALGFSLVPIIIGYRVLRVADKSTKIFWFYLLLIFITDATSEILRWVNFRNHFLYYFYSIWTFSLLFSIYYSLIFSDKLKKNVLLIFFLCIAILLVDLLFVTGFKNRISNFSTISINFIVLSVFVSVFASPLAQKFKSKILDSEFSYILLGTIITLFFKLILNIWTPFLLETELNYPLFYQLQNLVFFFYILSSFIFSWAFYQQKIKLNN